MVEAHVGEPSWDRYPWVEIFLGEHDGDHLEVIEALLPNLIALVNDPRVQEAKAKMAAYRATLPPEAIDAAMRRKERLLQHWSLGFNEGRKSGIGEILTDLRAVLAYGDAKKQAAIRIEPSIVDDRHDPRNGQQDGVTYTIDNGAQPGTSDYISLYIGDSYRPHNDPSMVFMGQSVEDLDAFCRLAPLALALLNSPEVQAARQRWAAMAAEKDA